MLNDNKTPLVRSYLQLRYQCYQQQLKAMLVALGLMPFT